VDSSNPYSPPETPAAGTSGFKPLGSLAQAARGNELNQARNTLIVIGLLTLAFNGFMYYNAPHEVNQLLNAEVQKAGFGAMIDPQARQNILTTLYALYGATAGLGLLFIFLGIIIKKFPVPITILSLVLYLAATALFACLEPMSLLQGIIVKVFIVLALVRAIRAARAYQEEVKAARLGDLAL